MTRPLLVAAAALAVALVAAMPGRHAPALELTAAHGALRLDSSRPGAAILSSRNLVPGATADGSVSVRNAGSVPARLFLDSSAPDATAGPNGGRLDDVLSVTVEDATAGTLVARGRLADLAGCHALGSLRPGESRAYRFTATFPKGSSDDAYAGARATVHERWIARDTDNGCGPSVAAAPGRARIVISHRRVRVARGRARVTLRCMGPAGARCQGTLRLSSTGFQSRRAAAAGTRGARFTLPAGAARAVRVRLPRSTRKRLERQGRAVALARAGSARRLITLVARRSR